MSEKQNNWFVGVLLVAIGLVFLVNEFFEIPLFENLGLFLLLGLGLAFLAWGIVARSDGLMIPGGILSGIGLGTVLAATVEGGSSGDLEGALFMGAFAMGWVVITVFSALFTETTHWWPLIPGAIMGLISAALLLDGPFMVALEVFGRLWPVLLIIGGIAMLLAARKMREEKDKSDDIMIGPDYDIDQLKKEEN